MTHEQQNKKTHDDTKHAHVPAPNPVPFDPIKPDPVKKPYSGAQAFPASYPEAELKTVVSGMCGWEADNDKAIHDTWVCIGHCISQGATIKAGTDDKPHMDYNDIVAKINAGIVRRAEKDGDKAVYDYGELLSALINFLRRLLTK